MLESVIESDILTVFWEGDALIFPFKREEGLVAPDMASGPSEILRPWFCFCAGIQLSQMQRGKGKFSHS